MIIERELEGSGFNNWVGDVSQMSGIMFQGIFPQNP